MHNFLTIFKQILLHLVSKRSEKHQHFYLHFSNIFCTNLLRNFFKLSFCTNLLRNFFTLIFCTNLLRNFFTQFFYTNFLYNLCKKFFIQIFYTNFLHKFFHLTLKDFFRSKSMCKYSNCNYTKNQPCMIIYLHTSVHLQPCFCLIWGFNIIQHPIFFR
jgi:hypothetical protein